MKKILIFGALVVIALGPTMARAQTPRGLRKVSQHEGLWISFGAGGGWEDYNVNAGDVGRGGAVYIRLGGTPSPRLLFGGEVLVWFNENRFGNEISRTNVMAVAQFYPSGRGGLFLKGGFGFSSYDIGGVSLDEGIGTTVGMGVDFRLGRNFYVTPNVDYMVQFFDRDTVGSVLVTLGVTWH